LARSFSGKIQKTSGYYGNLRSYRGQPSGCLAKLLDVDTVDAFDDALFQARAGDEAGFRVLWSKLQPLLRRYLQGLGCDDIDDVASETWLQAIRDLGRFTGSGADFRAWLLTLGRHRAIDAARSRARFQDKVLSVVPAERWDGVPVEEEVLYRLSSQRVAALTAGLSRDQAAVVQLRVIAGLDTEITARMLGKSQDAIRACLYRGLQRLSADPRIQVLATGTAGTT
jgi:RNA polymerase sigma-70 factor, ECF subfamily